MSDDLNLAIQRWFSAASEVVNSYASQLAEHLNSEASAMEDSLGDTSGLPDVEESMCDWCGRRVSRLVAIDGASRRRRVTKWWSRSSATMCSSSPDGFHEPAAESSKGT